MTLTEVFIFSGALSALIRSPCTSLPLQGISLLDPSLPFDKSHSFQVAPDNLVTNVAPHRRRLDASSAASCTQASRGVSPWALGPNQQLLQHLLSQQYATSQQCSVPWHLAKLRCRISLRNEPYFQCQYSLCRY